MNVASATILVLQPIVDARAPTPASLVLHRLHLTKLQTISRNTKKGGHPAAFLLRKVLLTEVSAAVFATEPCAGLTDEAVAGGVAVIVTAIVAVVVSI